MITNALLENSSAIQLNQRFESMQPNNDFKRDNRDKPDCGLNQRSVD